MFLLLALVPRRSLGTRAEGKKFQVLARNFSSFFPSFVFFSAFSAFSAVNLLLRTPC
jgi:hypothetical protein